MKKKMNAILKEVLADIKPSEKDLREIKRKVGEFKKDLEKEIKSQQVKAEVFLGGSVAKGTLTLLDESKKFDVDVFIIFDKKYKDISKMTAKILKGFNYSKVHGSRDYFIIKHPKYYFEVIPVIKISNSQEDNITDYSYLHVKYVKKKLNAEILDDVMLSKVFCYAAKCYGAESYIKGFSGYSLELLVYHYGGFLGFLRAVAKHKGGKMVIDIERHYKHKKDVLMDLNSSKLDSPIVLVDPTNKRRNVLACLSDSTFARFSEKCKEFLENPCSDFFEFKALDIEKIKFVSDKKKFVSAKIVTSKQEGDIAGSKLLKFYEHLRKEIGKFFVVEDSGFEYLSGKTADCFFVAKQKDEVLIMGPRQLDKENVKLFKKKHKITFIKDGRIYSKADLCEDLRDFLGKWVEENREKIKEMWIIGFQFS